MAPFANITDASIAAYQPVTGRLMTRYRDNQRAHRYISIDGCMFADTEKSVLDGSGDDGSWVSFPAPFSLYVPKYVVGPGGTVVRFYARVEAETNSQVTTSSSEFRIRYIPGNNNSTTRTLTVNAPSTTATDNDALLVITLTLTGDETIILQPQVKVTVDNTGVALVTARFRWQNQRGADSIMYNADGV